MSATIDERVVEMRFDNRDFESNVKTSMSTLDKLKNSLNLGDASKGLTNLGAAAKSVDMSQLGNGVETVRAKFSALDVIAVTALRNITDSAVNTGKRLVSAFTIDPVKTGLNEYELKMNSVQTIMMSTGESVETVNKYLEELNAYSDRTIYSFQDMTSNIGKFTNAGVKLEDAVLAMKGISNEAAVSGANANEASRAMYNLAQSISMGYVQYIDWKSIENANMATVEFKQNLANTALEMGTITKAGEDMYTVNGKNYTLQQLFKDAMKDQWLTTDALLGTLKNYADEETDIGKKAYEAAEKVKTFSQMMDVLKETAQSGWAMTWQLIFGDLEQAKSTFTALTNFFSNIIGAVDDLRNTFLSGVMGSPFGQLATKISSFAEATGEAAEKTKAFEETVNKVLKGDYGNGQARWDKLTKEGYNWIEVQNAVNEKLGSSFKRVVELTDAQKKQTGTVKELSDEKLIELGLTDLEIKKYRELEEQSKKTGKSIKELLEDETTRGNALTGRELVLKSFEHIGKGLVNVFKAVGVAWKSIFTSTMTDNVMKAYNALRKLYERSMKFDISLSEQGSTIDKITRTFKGLFAVLDLVRMVVGGGLNIAFKIFSSVLGKLGVGVLDLTAGIGDVLVGIHDWITSNGLIAKSVDLISDGIVYVIKHTSAWIKKLKELPQVQSAMEFVSSAFDRIGKCIESINVDEVFGIITDFFTKSATTIKRWFDAFKSLPFVQKGIETLSSILEKIGGNLNNVDFKSVGINILEGLKEGLRGGIESIPSMLADLGRAMIDAICGVLDIRSPSRVMESVGENVMEGLFNGIKNKLDLVLSSMGDVGEKIKEVFDGVDFGSVFAGGVTGTVLFFLVKLIEVLTSLAGSAGGVSVALVATLKKIGEAFNTLLKPVQGAADVMTGFADILKASAKPIGKILKNTAKVVKSFSKVLNSFAFKTNTEGLKNIAITLAILVGALCIMTLVDQDKLWESVYILREVAIILLVLVGVVALLSNVSGKLGTINFNVTKMSLTLLAIAGALLVMAIVIKVIGGMEFGQAIQGLAVLITMMGMIGGVIYLFGTYLKNDMSGNIEKAGAMFKKMAVTLLIMAIALKIVGTMDAIECTKGIAAMVLFGVFVTAMVLITKKAGKNVDKVGDMLLKISAAMLLMVVVFKLINTLSEEEIAKGIGGMILFGVFVFALIKIVNTAKKDAPKIGSTLIAISTAMILMALSVKIIAGIPFTGLVKGLAGIIIFGVIINTLIKTVTKAGPKAPKIAMTLIAISVAIAIMALIAVMLSLMSIEGLAKGIIAVSMLGLVMAQMIKATKGSKDCAKNIMWMSVAIATMALSAVALSFIEPSRLAGATVALGSLMAMFALIAKSASSLDKGVIAPLIIMVAAVGILAGIIYLMSDLPTEQALGASASLSLLLLSMSSAMFIASKAGTNALGAVGALALMGLVVAEIGLILGAMAYFNINPSIETAASLSLMLVAMAAACRIVSGIPVSAAIDGALSLASFVGIMGLLLIGLGGLAQIPGLTELVASGDGLLGQIGHALGNFVGSIVGGISEGVTSGLPGIATNLSNFVNNLQPFIEGIKGITPESTTGVKNLAEMIFMLCGANLVDSITSFITGESSISDFAAQLVPFGKAMVNFSRMVSGNIDEGAVTAAANAGKVIAEMANTIPNSGLSLASIFVGDNDLGDFSEKIVTFGKAMANFSRMVSGKIDEGAITAAANAGKTLVKLADAIPNTGFSLASIFVGDNDLAEFAKKLVPFGKAMAEFSKEVTGKIDEGAVKAAANGGKALAKMAEAIPNTGTSLASIIGGDNDLADFAEKLVPFGKAMAKLSAHVSGKIDEGSIETAVKCGKKIVKMANDIPNEGGLVSKISGDNDIAAFAKKLVPFGQAMASFSHVVSGKIDDDAIKSATKSFKSIINLAKSAEGVNLDGLANLSKSLENISVDGLNKFADAFESAGDKISSAGKKLAEGISKGIESGISSVVNMAGKLINEIINFIQGKATSFSQAGKALLDRFSSGIKTGGASANSTMLSVVSKLSQGVRGKYSEMSKAGKYLGEGLIEGIKAKETAVYNAAYRLGQKAVQGEKDGQKSNSPSKLTIQAGKWFGEGLVIGIERMGSKVYDAGYDLGDTAVKSLSSVVSRVSDTINSDMDMQPTIRPVVDMSGVTDSANTISDLFSLNPSVGLMSNVGAISTMMNRSQNGKNDDVISAIDKLSNRISNMPVNSYRIDSITYDDGSNVSNAVESLIRAARMERRI